MLGFLFFFLHKNKCKKIKSKKNIPPTIGWLFFFIMKCAETHAIDIFKAFSYRI